MAKTKSVVCGHTIQPGHTCTKKTKHPSGKCHLHQGAAGAAATDPVAANGDGATTDTTATSDPLKNHALGDEAVMPLPEDGPPAGDPLGVGVMVADGEIEDSSISAQRYLADGDGTYDMLHLKLTPEGEQKMLDALGLNTTVTKLVEKDVAHHGRHPLDVDHNLESQVEQIARSYNARLKKGESLDEIREVNGPRLDSLEQAFEQAAGKADADDVAAQEMLAHYQSHIDEFKKRMAAGYEPPPYTEGGKIPPMAGWQGDYTVTETVEEVIPNPDVDEALLPTVEKEGKRVNPQMADDGTSHWKPSMTTKSGAPPKMWEVDLGDGYKALYYPTSATEKAASGSGGSSQYAGASMRCRMTVISPKDGQAQVALDKLDKLHLNSRPMTRAEAEFTYLDRNAHSLELNGHKAVQTARAEAAEYAHGLALQRIHDRKHEAAGLSPAQQREWVRQQRVAADGDALPYRAKRLRDGLANALGYSSGAELRNAKGYDPTPVANASKPFFKRLPPTKGKSNAIGDMGFYCEMKKGADLILGVTESGALASQERRRVMGVKKGLGWSENEDVGTRGASSVFLYARKNVSSNSPSNAGFVWKGEQAQALADRADWYATHGDSFGSVNNASRTVSQLRSWGYGEVMVNDSIDLMATPPTAIKAGSSARRKKIIGHFHARGVTHFNDGRKVEDVVI